MTQKLSEERMISCEVPGLSPDAVVPDGTLGHETTSRPSFIDADMVLI